MKLKLFLLKRTDDVGYDEVAGQLIAARSKKRALFISSISGYAGLDVKQIGVASSGIKEGELLQDFRAG